MKKHVFRFGCWLYGFAPVQPMWGMGHFLMVMFR